MDSSEIELTFFFQFQERKIEMAIYVQNYYLKKAIS